MKLLKFCTIFLILNFIFLLPVFAQIGGTDPGGPIGGTDPSSRITNPIQSNTFGELMAKIGLPLVAVFMIYAGFLFVSARGNEEQLTKAKTTFFWTIIGALLVVGAFAISLAIKDFAQKL